MLSQRYIQFRYLGAYVSKFWHSLEIKYEPGQGLITKSNIGPEPDIGSVFYGEPGPCIWNRCQQGDLHTNDGLLTAGGIYTMCTFDIHNDPLKTVKA